ncbi:MAG: carboxypeptidase-like regulatory domain-containing protein, partial [Bacteroidales bacterium]|nr:carboxypeptidase-like regulatory domain-containing protein [Bacteroidales bacterium]
MKKMLTVVLCFLMALPGLAATQGTQVRISGTVVDQAGVALPGAYVSVAGTKTGIGTGIDGTFSLNVPANATLLITYVGFKTVEIPVGEQRVFNIVMEEDAKLLDDLVVIGYGVQRKSDVTGAIAKISTQDIENRSVSRIEEALQGKTAGVQIVTTSGAPGKGMDIRVRGISSNSNSVNPI